MNSTSSHTVRLATGYQMAYARWLTLRFGKHPYHRPVFFGYWAEMQGQLDNPRPHLLTDEEQSRG